ncbi:ribonuclease H-like domain-containing protein [Rhizophagus clarus]|uniref:Ribonuclease H-like domain-containing protein n=1 Tax=Rhizophagus clarus TaxID=94130 RepID=A0A8H3LZ27_9GLOM|nr:ribonuclease H-like domain-containing protein [Rhizophagus clarus]
MDLEKHTVAMKTPIIIDDIEVKAIIDTGAAASAISSALLEETQFAITEKSNTRCIMADGSRVASLGKTEIEIEIGEIITPILVEVIDSKDWTLIIGNDFLAEWNSNIDFESKTMTLQDKEYIIEIPITYYRQKKVTFEVHEENFEEEIIEYSSLDDDVHENDIYQEIYNILKEEDEMEELTKQLEELKITKQLKER